MIDAEVAGAFVQFGTAGLIGWMWLTERREASTAARQLREAHERIAQERVATDTLLTALRDNTRVLAQLDEGQRALRDTMIAIGLERFKRGEVEQRRAG